MIIKKFVADTEDEALALVRRDLGQEAIVLARKVLRPSGWKALFAAGKVELTAAVDARAQQPTPPVQAAPQASPKERPAASDYTQNLQGLKEAFAEAESPGRQDQVALSSAARAHMARQEAQVQQAQRQVATQAQDSVERTARGLLEQFGAQEEPVPTKAPKSKPQAVEAGPTPEELRRLIRDEVRQAQQRAPEEEAQEPVGSVRFLVSKGVSEDIARDIEARVEARVGQTDMREASPQRTRRINVLREEIAERLLIAGPIRLQPGQTTAVALIGPNGVGKTTTLMKLAVQYAHTLKKRVAVISLDNSKVGAREQITGLAEKYQIPHQIVDSPFGLMQALREFGERDLVLLDTAGRSQYDRRALDELAEFLAVVDNLQTYLTVSAATKDIDIFGTIQQYAPIPHDGLIVTKLDETIAYGVMVNVCEKMHSALAYIAAGARIPEDLKVASGEDIARMLLVHHNSQEYRQIRAMVS